MSQPDYTLVFVTGPTGQVTLHADTKGLAILIASLEGLKTKAKKGICEHEHFFTVTPGDGLLSDRKGAAIHGEIVTHLELCGWSDE